MKKRIDRLLQEKNLVSSRNQATELVKEGHVYIGNQQILKPSLKIDPESVIEIRKEQIFVGRGAHKIEGAHRAFDISFEGKVIGDMGASTGGFTEYALLQGAKKVYAVDVGIDQLAPKLRADERVVNLEGRNIREGLSFDDCDLIVTDLSFISLTKVIEAMTKALKEAGEFVFLVKPQFEVGKSGLGKNGVVRDFELIKDSVLAVVQCCQEEGMIVRGCQPCAIKGKMGNQEFFIYGVKGTELERIKDEEIENTIRASL